MWSLLIGPIARFDLESDDWHALVVVSAPTVCVEHRRTRLVADMVYYVEREDKLSQAAASSS